MDIELYQVDAFTDKVFGGNPAAVCLLKEWLPDHLLQNIALENNLSETAFFVPTNNSNSNYHLRWFTPATEVDLCGHATLAAAFVIFEFINNNKDKVIFKSKSGNLVVEKTTNGLKMDLPAWDIEEIEITGDFIEALGAKPKYLFKGEDWLAIFDNKKDIENLDPNMERLKQIPARGILASSIGNNDIDFVSRCFFPAFGVPEDPVTGSAHCTLVPYWAKRLGKNQLTAKQISSRGGGLLCALKGDRVEIIGNAALYLHGTINV